MLSVSLRLTIFLRCPPPCPPVPIIPKLIRSFAPNTVEGTIPPNVAALAEAADVLMNVRRVGCSLLRDKLLLNLAAIVIEEAHFINKNFLEIVR